MFGAILCRDRDRLVFLGWEILSYEEIRLAVEILVYQHLSGSTPQHLDVNLERNLELGRCQNVANHGLGLDPGHIGDNAVDDRIRLIFTGDRVGAIGLHFFDERIRHHGLYLWFERLVIEDRYRNAVHTFHVRGRDWTQRITTRKDKY